MELKEGKGVVSVDDKYSVLTSIEGVINGRPEGRGLPHPQLPLCKQVPPDGLNRIGIEMERDTMNEITVQTISWVS
ncbi:hypothetical protein HS1genome_1137 [Sulfodiicoccus acidiphilus]|uniref:Uncharacterized protein n=1 Tax=Sulfodiicoccus acidiphilus TaxID=1670455 RepID=A0A348B3J6_9CREN|nr:hypothetical protein HS1genome_1137 [Sulfodiicoccus acidiphilus]GGT99531.1 hypothetical protein GCM10007116_16120 [Sulfodiicoccus acidiphilus]